MIKKTRDNVFVATEDDRCGEDILFIRDDPNVLYHICKRSSGSFDTEQYLVGEVMFDYTLGTYMCGRAGCREKFALEDVWADFELTGWEFKC